MPVEPRIVDQSPAPAQAAPARHVVKLRSADGSDCSFGQTAGLPLLHGMVAAGRSAIPVGCRGGGCGICRVRVLAGAYASRPMSRSRISAADEAAGIVLACRIVPQEDMTVEAYPLRRDGMATKEKNAACATTTPPDDKGER